MQIINRAIKAILEKEDIQALEKAWSVLSKIYRLTDSNTGTIYFSKDYTLPKEELYKAMRILNQFNTQEPFEVY